MIEGLIKTIKRFSNLCWENTFARYALFTIATFLTILIMGYHFGTFDQGVHIPFLKKFIDPTLFPNDHFFDMRFVHVSFFWFLFIPFYRLGILEISMFITYVGIIYLTYLGIWRLTKTLFNNPLVSFLSVIIFVLPHIGFGMFPIFEFSLLNRTFVLPFLLFAIDHYLNKRYLLSYFLLGVFYNFHVISVNFVLAMFLFDSILRIKEIGLKKLLSSFLLFIVSALPVLIWKMKVAPVDFSIHKEWYDIISKGELYHLFAILPLDPKLLILTISGLGTLGLFVIGMKDQKKSSTNRIVINFIVTVILILIVEFITSQWLPITIIIESQIIRAGLFLLLFGYLFFLNLLVTSFPLEEKKNWLHFTLFLIIALLSITPIMLFISWMLYRIRHSSVLLKFLTVCSFCLLIISSIVILRLNMWYPGIYIFAKHDDDYNVQQWAKNNTEKSDIFITPPHWWWFYNLEWRVISERSTVATLFDLAEAAFSPEYMKWWIPRFNALAPHVIERFDGNVIENRKMIAQAYYSLTPQRLYEIGKTYHARYMVVEKPHAYPFRQVYENDTFIVYQLSP